MKYSLLHVLVSQSAVDEAAVLRHCVSVSQVRLPSVTCFDVINTTVRFTNIFMQMKASDSLVFIVMQHHVLHNYVLVLIGSAI